MLILALLLAASVLQTFSAAGDAAAETLTDVYYAGSGLWRECDLPSCSRVSRDWGADSATYTLYLRWANTRDPALQWIASSLLRTAPRYPLPCASLPCSSWSDVPEWDAIALLREYEMTQDARALVQARSAFDFVQHSRVYALGACPQIRYQVPGGGRGYQLKTLETDANSLKAALLLYRATRERRYLEIAVREYGAIRTYFLDPQAALYTVYVFDDGERCTQLPRRFFASVNGDMIWSGVALARMTGTQLYRAQALQTARAVDERLSDGAGVFANLQAENDVAEPLVEAMYVLANEEHQAFARAWILRNARAALQARTPDGAFGRFFDGPAPESPSVSIWQSNGGLALEIAAAALNPNAAVSAAGFWNDPTFFVQRISALPAAISFYGSGIALYGTLGAHCCEPGHSRVFIDGKETFDGTGIWQNKSMTGSVANTVLFAWRWRTAGPHTLRLEPGIPNAKEGGPFLDASGYLIPAASASDVPQARERADDRRSGRRPARC